ncbi:MAG TPA: HU family DNA-binding protein [Myxococcota bacterium]|nr:HU family DNA-binding protein [Myxococcota bacterium]
MSGLHVSVAAWFGPWPVPLVEGVVWSSMRWLRKELWQMNKAQLTEILAERAGIPKVRAASYINIVTGTIQEALLRDEKVTISDFGTFTVSRRRQFAGHNPKNGEAIDVPSRRIPVFRAGKGLKRHLNPE